MSAPLDDLIPPAEQSRILEAIRVAELRSSGEIKVHLESECWGGDPYKRAATLFTQLGLDRTRERNGVLIYVAVRDRKFALIGDVGIHEEVGSPFWQDAVSRMAAAFRSHAYGLGIASAIESVGQRLAARFPRAADDVNEIPDAISTDQPKK